MSGSLRVVLLAVITGSLAAVAACSGQTYTPGPTIAPPTLVAAAVASGAPIKLTFARFLSPATLSSRSVALEDGEGTAVAAALSYDPATLTVTLTNPTPGGTWTTTGTAYDVVVSLALQAIDGATLAAAVTLPVTVSDAVTVAAPEPTMHFCVDVLPVFQSKCAYGPCHVTPQSMTPSPRFPDGMSSPAAGLVLDSSYGVDQTAVSHVAHASNVNATAGVGGPPSNPFGIGMPILDPGAPGNSWLLYKTLLAIPPAEDDNLQGICGPYLTASSFARSATSPVTSDERARLSELIPGREMPYPMNPAEPEPAMNPGDAPLSIQELERLRAWIEQGAVIEDCTQCVASQGGSP